jgi:hypothetical protein
MSERYEKYKELAKDFGFRGVFVNIMPCPEILEDEEEFMAFNDLADEFKRLFEEKTGIHPREYCLTVNFNWVK